MSEYYDFDDVNNNCDNSDNKNELIQIPNKYYTGVGSRSTPSEILDLMKNIAIKLSNENWILRSGGAIGADNAFEKGVDSVNGKKEIYFAKHANQKAIDLAATIHPAWNKCTDYVKKLHARNCFQVLGYNLNIPSKILICWTKDGKDIGGTRTAIVLARKNKIRVLNLALAIDFDTIMQYMYI